MLHKTVCHISFLYEKRTYVFFEMNSIANCLKKKMQIKTSRRSVLNLKFTQISNQKFSQCTWCLIGITIIIHLIDL